MKRATLLELLAQVLNAFAWPHVGVFVSGLFVLEVYVLGISAKWKPMMTVILRFAAEFVVVQAAVAPAGVAGVAGMLIALRRPVGHQVIMFVDERVTVALVVVSGAGAVEADLIVAVTTEPVLGAAEPGAAGLASGAGLAWAHCTALDNYALFCGL